MVVNVKYINGDLQNSFKTKYKIEKPISLKELVIKLSEEHEQLGNVLFADKEDGKIIILPYVILNTRGKQKEISTELDYLFVGGEQVSLIMPVLGG